MTFGTVPMVDSPCRSPVPMSWCCTRPCTWIVHALAPDAIEVAMVERKARIAAPAALSFAPVPSSAKRKSVYPGEPVKPDQIAVTVEILTMWSASAGGRQNARATTPWRRLYTGIHDDATEHEHLRDGPPRARGRDAPVPAGPQGGA